MGYQITDRCAFDYNMYFIDKGQLGLRGPRCCLGKNDYLVFTGAAQTFGRFVHEPFPAQVGRLSQKPFLNLGVSGAGPEFYLKRPSLMTLIAEAEIHIMQTMSGRSVSAGLFECQGNNGVVRFLEGSRKNETMLAADAYHVLRKEYGEDAYLEQVKSVQQRWVELYFELISKTGISTYLIWVSEKNIGENINHSSVLGEFPHFVTKAMIDEVKSVCTGVIDCSFVTSRPQPIVSDINGKIVDVFDRETYPQRPDYTRAFNVYYATPKHHDFIAASILKTLAVDGRY
ncbi:MAG TPA: hypothetical protein ENJ32_13875 [Crenotrichaceae bacterium]|nr:hypothetical protein [Crenotrichaceae bacterium]